MPSIRTQFTWLLALCLILGQIPAAHVHAEDVTPAQAVPTGEAAALDRLVASGDVQLSTDTIEGATVSPVSRPDKIQAGLAPLLIIGLWLLAGFAVSMADEYTKGLALESAVRVGVKRVEKAPEYASCQTVEGIQDAIQAEVKSKADEVLSKYGWWDLNLAAFIAPEDVPDQVAANVAKKVAPFIYLERLLADVPPEKVDEAIRTTLTEAGYGVDEKETGEKVINALAKTVLKEGPKTLASTAKAKALEEFGRKYASTVGKELLGAAGKGLGQAAMHATGKSVFANVVHAGLKGVSKSLGVISKVLIAKGVVDIGLNWSIYNQNQGEIAQLDGLPDPLPTPTPGSIFQSTPIATLPNGTVIVTNPSNFPSGSTGGGGGGGSGGTSGGGGSLDLITNGNFALGLFGWQNEGSAPVMSTFGPIGPPTGSVGPFAAPNTGLGDVSALGSITQTFNVPTSRVASLEVIYNFVTNEFPEFYGTQFNDSFRISLTGPAGTLAIEQSALNNHQFSEYAAVAGLPTNLMDNSTGGQLGWRAFSEPNLALSPGNYTLRIEVRDVTDQIFDSAMLVDRASLR